MKNESEKKSLEKSKNVLEEKRKKVKRKVCIKKQHVYNNCYELRSRAINKLAYEIIRNCPHEVKKKLSNLTQDSQKGSE